MGKFHIKIASTQGASSLYVLKSQTVFVLALQVTARLAASAQIVAASIQSGATGRHLQGLYSNHKLGQSAKWTVPERQILTIRLLLIRECAQQVARTAACTGPG